MTTATVATAPRPTRTATERIVNVVRLQFANPTTVLFTPLMILGFIFLVNWIIWLLIRIGTGGTEANAGVSQGLQYSGASLWIFVYMMVVAIIAMNSTFGLGLSLGATRRDYYLGTALTFVILSVFYSLLYTMMAAIEGATNGWGIGGSMFRAIYFGQGPWYEQFFTVFCLFLFFFFIGTIYGGLYVRWKQFGVLLFSAFLVLLIIGGLFLLTVSESWVAFGEFFARIGFVGGYALSLPISLLAAVCGFFILRRATPRS